MRKPGGHVTPNDVMLNPMATLDFYEADDLLVIIRASLDELERDPPKVVFESNQAKTSARFWIDRVAKHVEVARIQKENYQSSGDWQWLWDLEQAERVAANLLGTIKVRPEAEADGPPFSPLSQWVDYFTRAYRFLAKAKMQARCTCMRYTYVHTYTCTYICADCAGGGAHAGGQGGGQAAQSLREGAAKPGLADLGQTR